MNIYKLFFQLLKEHKTTILLNTLLLLAITIPINALYQNNFAPEFELAKSDVGIINHDADHMVTKNFMAHLAMQANITEMAGDAEEIADALYFQRVAYILTIPAGFGQALLDPSVEDVPLEKRVTQAPEAEANIDLIINKYLTNLELMSAKISDSADSQEVQLVLEQLTQQLDQSSINIVPAEEAANVSLFSFGTNYLHFISYVMLSVLISTFGYVTLSMRDPEIVKRDRMGMIKPRGRLLQMLLGCITFSFVYWLILIAAGGFIYGFDTVLSQRGLLLVLNSFLSVFGIQALAYFAATIANSKGAVSFMSTLLSLLVAFASGIFVPRNFVIPFMQQIASFATPIWQVKAGEIIMESPMLTPESLAPAFQMMGIQVLIGVTFYLISFVYQKYRHQFSVY